ncbi:MAG: hypothetical protein CBC35_00080 [Planctomycetes bacterium TMED75]|nr:hypothetical protein [Planctomycetaceae bacterium]OUU96929.1 MAG: hypothetical protein CBC35_00080 [Planctomycetes bacterium TMED75]
MSAPDSHEDQPPTGSETKSGGSGESGPALSFKNKAIRGSTVSLAQTGVSRVISLACQVLFARMLMPSDFGLAAIAIGTMSLLTIASPLALEDVLVQRGKRLANVLPSAWRLMIIAGCLTSAAILLSTQLASTRAGDRINVVGDEVISSATLLGTIRSDPPLGQLVEETRGEIEILWTGGTGSFTLPKVIGPQTTLGEYVSLLQKTVTTAIGTDQIQVKLDQASGRVEFRELDGAQVRIETNDSVAGNVLEVLGIPYRSNTLMLLLILLATRPLIQVLRAPFTAAARLSLRFEQLAIGFMLGDILGYSMAILVLFMGGGPIALIMPIIFLPLVVLANSMRMSWPLPKVPKDQREPMLPMLKDAVRVWLSQWSIGMSRNLPPLILAFFVTDGETGLYNWAALISVQVNALLTDNIKIAMVPIFSNLQKQPDRLISGFLQAARGMSGVTLPLFAGATAITPVLIPVIFGEKWIPAVSIAAILLMAQSFASTNSLCVSLLKGTGRYRTWLWLQAVRTIAFIATAFIGSWLAGGIGLAWGMFVMFTIFPLATLWICARGHSSLIEVVRINGIPLFASLPFILVAIGTGFLDADWLSLLVWCPLMLIGGLLAYIVIMRIIDADRCREIMTILRQMYQRLQSLRRRSAGR